MGRSGCSSGKSFCFFFPLLEIGSNGRIEGKCENAFSGFNFRFILGHERVVDKSAGNWGNSQVWWKDIREDKVKGAAEEGQEKKSKLPNMCERKSTGNSTPLTRCWLYQKEEGSKLTRDGLTYGNKIHMIDPVTFRGTRKARHSSASLSLTLAGMNGAGKACMGEAEDKETRFSASPRTAQPRLPTIRPRSVLPGFLANQKMVLNPQL